ncbi:MAG: hypothetical protein RL595_865, partial [Planctomycetota bacterium]
SSIYRFAQTVQQCGAVPLVVIKAVELNLGYIDTGNIVRIGHTGRIALGFKPTLAGLNSCTSIGPCF